MTSVTITTKQRSDTVIKFYVYYDHWTGELISVGRNKRNDIDNPFIETSSELAKQLVAGDINERQYLVSFDENDELSLIKKDHILRLRKQEENLFLLPDYRLQEWDIRVKLYTINHKLTVEINPNSIKRLANFNSKTQIKVEDKSRLNLFLIKRNQPDFLIDTFEIDPVDLLQHQHLVVDISDILRHASYDNISILTRRHFKNYYMEVINNKYVGTPTASSKSTRTSIVRAEDNELNHFAFEQIDNRVIVNSQLIPAQFADLGLFKPKETFYVVGDSPDELLGQFDIDITKMRAGYVEQFIVDDTFDIDNINIIYDNPRLVVSKRKLQ